MGASVAVASGVGEKPPSVALSGNTTREHPARTPGENQPCLETAGNIRSLRLRTGRCRDSRLIRTHPQIAATGGLQDIGRRSREEQTHSPRCRGS